VRHDRIPSPSDFSAELEALIREHGWAVQGVFNTTAPGPSGWVYTIGLEDQGRPELAIVGLPLDTAHGLLHALLVDVVDGIRSWPTVGDTIVGLVHGGYGLRVVAVDPGVAAAGDWFLGALARRGTVDDFRPLQLVWQEADYSWPDGRSDRQPVLGDRWW
jgi:hypothetical protein